MQPHPCHYIRGQWQRGSGKEFLSLNPATGQVIWKGNEAGQGEVDFAFKSAHDALSAWSRYSFEERVSFVSRLEGVLASEKKRLAEVISQDTGKPYWESLSEVTAMIRKISISIEAYKERCKEKRQPIERGALITFHKPHGVCAVFGPFNFPGHLPHGHIVPALLAGNTIIFKSSEKTPLFSEEYTKCWEKAYLPPGVVNLLQGGPSVGDMLVHHSGLNGLFFTGSYSVGIKIREALVKHNEKILALEMGGNNPLIVDDIDDGELAAYLTIQSAYLTTGQRCTSARRLIVVGGDEFIRTLTKMIQTIKIGDYREKPEPFMGPLIDMKSMETLLKAQEELIAKGGLPLVPMKNFKPNLPFLTPGLIDVTPIYQREDIEFFGPLLQLIRVNSFEEAIAEANRTEFGLSAGLFSKSHEKFEKFFHEIKAGVINWNSQITQASSNAPFGGIGKSGNFRPSAYYAADYSAYPVASIKCETLQVPRETTPGIGYHVRS